MIDDVNFDVNNNPTNTPTDAPTTPTKAVSHSKVHAVVSVTPKSNDSINGYQLMDVSILDSVIGDLKCPDCLEQSLFLKEHFEKKN